LGLPILSIGLALVYFHRHNWERLPYALPEPLGFGIVLTLGGLTLLLSASILNVNSLDCQFDKEQNQFHLSYRAVLWEKNIKRSLFEIRQVKVEQDEDVDGHTVHRIVLMMQSSERILLPRLMHPSTNRQTYEAIAEKITVFLGLQD
jgi:hypothetical protein